MIRISTLQAEEREHAAVLAEEGSVPSRRLLLEEAQGRQDHQGGPHEAQGPGHGGNKVSLFVDFSCKECQMPFYKQNSCIQYFSHSIHY